MYDLLSDDEKKLIDPQEIESWKRFREDLDLLLALSTKKVYEVNEECTDASKPLPLIARYKRDRNLSNDDIILNTPLYSKLV